MNKIKKTSRVLPLFTLLSVATHADGVVHIPEPSGGWSYPGYGWYHSSSVSLFDQGITFGEDMAIVPTIDGLSFVRRDPSSYQFFEFVASEVMISDPNSGYVSLGVDDFTLNVYEGLETGYLTLHGIGYPYPYMEFGISMISFGDGGTGFPDTHLERWSSGVLRINGQNIVTQNGLANYVTVSGAQTLTNKSIDAGQLTGNLAVAKGGTGLTSYAAGDLLYATGATTLGKLSPASTGNVLLSGTSPAWGKVGLTTHVSGILPVSNGGTGATALTGILKGNGTSAFTTVSAPSGTLVGTTDTQTLSNKTLSNPTVAGTLNGDANGLNLTAPVNKNLTLTVGGAGTIILNGAVSAADLVVPGVQTSYVDFSSNGLTDVIEYNPGNYLSMATRYALELRGDDGIDLYSNSTIRVHGEFAAGSGVTANGFASAAFGEETQASMPYAVAFGYQSHASGVSSMAIGDLTEAKGYAALAAGEATVAKAYSSVALGRGNVEQGNQNAWVATDDLVAVGNGDESARANALALHKNGNLRVAGAIDARQGVRTPPMGDIGMGSFTSGPNPAVLNAGLRYVTE